MCNFLVESVVNAATLTALVVGYMWLYKEPEEIWAVVWPILTWSVCMFTFVFPVMGLIGWEDKYRERRPMHELSCIGDLAAILERQIERSIP